MVTWQAATVRTANALAELLDADQVNVDLGVAITARAAVLDHVANVLGDIVPRTNTRHATGHLSAAPVALIENDPLEGLGRVLHSRARPALDRAPSELLDVHQTVDAVTEQWVEVGRFALAAGQAWSASRWRPLDDKGAWHAVGEVACLAEAVARIDRRLMVAAEARPDLQAVIASTAGLRIAAHEVVALTGADEARAAAPPRRDGTAIADALARRSGRERSISQDIRRLTALLGRAEELTPEQLRTCAAVTRDLAILAAGEAVDRAGAKLRPELGDIARALHDASRLSRGEFAINPVEQRVLMLQLRDLRATTTLAFATRTAPGQEEATRIARRLPDVVDLLAEKARVQIEGARWAMPDRREDAKLPYSFASGTDPVLRPPMLDGLAQACDAVVALRREMAPPLARSALASALSARVASQPISRPAHPAANPGSAPGREWPAAAIG